MNKKYVLVECLSNINQIIKQPLQQTQRIKFTTFDVSTNYLAFGASSGGVYIFSRHPCKFIKLIPSKEGVITDIAASQDEKSVAVATKKGVIVIMENCFSDSSLRSHVYSVQDGNVVTAMKWHSNELYCGYQTGQISVISRTNLLAKTIFQATCEPLMKLDSFIVQIDGYMKYLLVSTRTRTYLCNVEQEEYKQIGKKLRVGNFGACFSVVDKAKIYCARPGCRLWETDFESNVVCTHQFRESLQLKQSDLIHLDDDCTRFKVTVHSEDTRVSESFSFCKIKVVGKFILTFNENGFYIFDVDVVALVFWIEFKGITDLKVFEGFVYVWSNTCEIKCFRLIETDRLILQVLSQKRYEFCAELCIFCKDDVLLSIQNDRLHTIGILRKKLSHRIDLLEQVLPLLEEIKDYKSAVAQKLKNGIFIVDNIHHHQKTVVDEVVRENSDDEMNILYGQYQLNKINSNTETPKLTELLFTKSFDEVTALLKKFPMYLKEEESESKLWCNVQMLRFISKGKLDDFDVDSSSFQFVQQSFVNVNASNVTSNTCVCSFPLPGTTCTTPHFFAVGCEILKKCWSSDKSVDVCKLVPYMYKYLLLELRKDDDIVTLLPMLLQYSVSDVFSKFCSKLSYDLWDVAIKLMIKLKRNVCLNCERIVKFDSSSTINWTVFGKLMQQQLGGPSTIKLLTRYSKHIPPGELEANFYQTCIFTSVLENLHSCDRYKATNFIKDENTKEQCSILLEKYLNGKYLGNLSNRSAVLRSSCSICEFSLQSSILGDFTKLPCGHHCHVVCLEREEFCNVCDKK